ncbi:MAG: DUF3352 domain-containing protein [Cyanobacteria bacterium J06632_22]
MITVLTVILVGVLTVGCGRSSVEVSATVAADVAAVTGFVPQNAILTAAVLFPPDGNAVSLGAAAPLQSAFRQRTGLDYDHDLKSWLGGDGVAAILPTPEAPPAYLLALSVADADRARECLELLWQRQALAGHPPVLTRIDGADAFLPEPDTVLWPMALVGNRYLILASTEAALRRSLRAAQAPTQSLPYQPRYRAALSTMPMPQWGLLHIRLPAAIAAAGLAEPRSIQPQFQSGLISVTTEPQAIVLHTALLGKPLPAATVQPSAQLDTVPVPVALLPEAVTAVAAGHNLADWGRGLAKELGAYRQLPYPLTQIQQRWSMPLGKAALPILETWLTGAYAIARTGSGDGILLVEHTAAAKPLVAKLDHLAEQHGLTVTALTVQEQPVTAWTRLRTRTQDNPSRNRQGAAQRETVVETEVVALHMVYQGYDLWATSIAALAETLKTTGAHLVDDSRFQRAVPLKASSWDDFQDDVVYLNATALVAQLSGQLPLLDLLGIAAQPFLDQLDTIVIDPKQARANGGRVGQRAQVTLRFTSS